jgi:hypothetical protein
MPCLLLPLRLVLPGSSSDPANCAETASISSKWRSSLCVRFSLPVSSSPVSDIQSVTCEAHNLRRDRFGLKLYIASATPELHKLFVDALDNVQKTYVAAQDLGCWSPSLQRSADLTICGTQTVAPLQQRSRNLLGFQPPSRAGFLKPHGGSRDLWGDREGIARRAPTDG